jgi:hypothetical protein
LVADWVRSELTGYLLRTSDPSRKALSTRWQPWTVLDITRHHAASFERFIRLLRQSRVGDLRPPFEPGELSAENLPAVERLEGDPRQRLQTAVNEFVDAAIDSNELMAHQFGPINVGFQMRFALNELAIHQDDVTVAQVPVDGPTPRLLTPSCQF